MKKRQTLIVGLPESGKTTFIAALWHVVESDEIPSSLRVKELVGDRSELNKLRTTWLQCEKIRRTSQLDERVYLMKLSERDGGQESELILPDMSGESFRDQWEYRAWKKDYDRLVENADGALMFVHPNKIVEPIRIDTVNTIAEVLPSDEDAAATEHARPVVWDPKKAPTQVQLVDILQFISSRRPPRLFNVALIVSAWDLVKAQQKLPSEWCRARLPLLMQYLDSNEDRFIVSAYGVSAQGGALPQDAVRLRDLTYASQRIAVLSDDGATSADITLPIQHLARENP